MPVRIRRVSGENIERVDTKIGANVDRWQERNEGITDRRRYKIIFSALAGGYVWGIAREFAGMS
jgi:hypothetical protein